MKTFMLFLCYIGPVLQLWLWSYLWNLMVYREHLWYELLLMLTVLIAIVVNILAIVVHNENT